MRAVVSLYGAATRNEEPAGTENQLTTQKAAIREKNFARSMQFFSSLLVIRKGRIGEAVVAHATANALLAAYVLTYHQWHLW